MAKTKVMTPKATLCPKSCGAANISLARRMMNIEAVAREIKAAVDALQARDTTSLRAVRKRFGKELASELAAEMIELAKTLIRKHGVPNFIGYELLASHKAARAALSGGDLDDLTHDLNSWW